MTYREISIILGLSEQVVRNYSYRAIRKLKGNVDQLKLNAEV